MIRLSLLTVTFLAAMFLATTFVTVTGPAFAQAPGAEAARIHRDALVFDAHLHFVNRQLYLGGDIGERLPGPMSGIGIDLPNAKDGGIDAMFLNLYVEPEYVEHGYEVKQTVKLIELAQELDAKIVTNDFNLNKVAQVRGVQVLNINELANALKPVVLPGEFMRVFILKEGKEYNQGVAYLDDGTMVVVDNARKLLGKNVDVTVTSVLQTTAGKMIFGKAIESAAERAAAR